MQVNLLHYSVGLGFIVILTGGIAYRSLMARGKPGSRTFSLLMLSMAIWAAFYLLEIIVPTLPLKIISRKILYLGATMSAPLWLGFALRYTGISTWWSKGGNIYLLIVPGLIAFLLGMTNESHALIWRTLELSSDNGLGPLNNSFGSGFWLYTTVAYCFAATGVLIYIITYFRSPKIFRNQTGVMLLGALTILITNAIFLSGIFPHNVDPTPLSFGLSAPLLALGFFRFGLLNLFPIAAPMVVEHLKDSVIVVDAQNRITDLNTAAQKWLDMDHSFIGAFVFDSLPLSDDFRNNWDIPNTTIKLELMKKGRQRWYEASIIQLHNGENVLLGRVIVIHDITQEQELLETEFRRSAQLALLEEVGRQVADTFNEKEILQRSIDAVVNRFGYAEAAISLLTDHNMLEVAAIAGTQDFGYRPGYQQEMGKGIIGRTAAIRKTYISDHVASDPYYFSNETHHGSAICIPILNEGSLLGVLYVESAEPYAFNQQDASTLETLANHISASLQRASLYSRAQEHLRIMSTVQAVSHAISSSLDLETIFQTVVKVLKQTFGYTHVSIYLLKDDYLYLGAQFGYPYEMIIHKIHVSQGVTGRTVKTKTVQFIRDTSREPAFLRADDNITGEICVPLLKENTVLGTINVEGDAKRPLTQEDAHFLRTLSGPIALAVDNARLHAQIKMLALTDAVSGLSNRHAFEETLTAEVERAARLGFHLSLIIFDLDSFKDYNDEWGHPAGDVRLKATADLIRKNLRKYDTAARYGGDEFAIILPNTDQSSALEFSKRLHEAAQLSTRETPIDGKGVAGYTLSMGIATFPEDGNTISSILIAADHAALMAKRLGKNQIYLASDLRNYGQA